MTSLKSPRSHSRANHEVCLMFTNPVLFPYPLQCPSIPLASSWVGEFPVSKSCVKILHLLLSSSCISFLA